MSGQKEFQCTRSTFQVVYYSVKVSDISGVWCKALHYTTLNILNSFDIAEVYNWGGGKARLESEFEAWP